MTLKHESTLQSPADHHFWLLILIVERPLSRSVIGDIFQKLLFRVYRTKATTGAVKTTL